MKCLRCECELEVLKNDDVEVDVCTQGCGGMWFDPFELKKMNEKSELTQEFIQKIYNSNQNFVDKKPRLECPKCQAKMLRHFHSVRREIEIDQCSQCFGHWLDGGELLKIVSQFKTQEEHVEATRKFFAKLRS